MCCVSDLSTESPLSDADAAAAAAAVMRKKEKEKKIKGLKKLWKQFHAYCEQSSSRDPLGCDAVLNYSPGATPNDLPVLI